MTTTGLHLSTGYLSPVIATCPDCGDLSLEITSHPCRALADGLRLQCATCAQYQADDEAAKHRAAVGAVNLALATGIVSGRIQTGGCNDERYVPCDECGDTAVTYAADVSAHALSGRLCQCESCGTHGKIVLADDGESAWLSFRQLTDKELAAHDLLEVVS